MSGSLQRERFGWYVYDWANSAFYTTVVVMFLGPYMDTVLTRNAADAQGYIYPFGLPVYAASYWGYLISLSVILQVIALPVAGAIADASGNKKGLLALFAYVGAAATMAMYFLDGAAYLLGGALFIVANVTFGASVVVYNSFLPDLAAEDERDAVSSRGWALGYLGGGLLLALNLALYMNAERLGLTTSHAVRISLASAGLWWAAFTLIPLATLRNRPRPAAHSGIALRTTFVQLASTLASLRRYPLTLTFLLAYVLYNDAVQAVIALAGQFAAGELKVSIGDLTPVILAVQFVAFFGALLFGWVARATGTKAAIMMQLAIWTATIIGVYGWVRTLRDFWIAAIAVGIVLGGTQALSRSLFSMMIPKNREAEYFGLYEVVDKGTSSIAPLIFAITLQQTHSYRYAILSLIVFFIAGMGVLVRVDVGRAAREAAGLGSAAG